jgi:hypothetical protein
MAGVGRFGTSAMEQAEPASRHRDVVSSPLAFGRPTLDENPGYGRASTGRKIYFLPSSGASYEGLGGQDCHP